MEKFVCIQYPHLFKPTQAINAVFVMICLGSATTIDRSEWLWFVTLLSLMVSTVATIIFMMNKDEPLITSMAGDVFMWNVFEFGYSTVLAILCGISFWLSFSYAFRGPIYGNSMGYTLTGIFMLAQSLFYAIPSLLLYDRFQCNKETNICQQHYQTIEEDRYQVEPAIIV